MSRPISGLVLGGSLLNTSTAAPASTLKIPTSDSDSVQSADAVLVLQRQVQLQHGLIRCGQDVPSLLQFVGRPPPRVSAGVNPAKKGFPALPHIGPRAQRTRRHRIEATGEVLQADTLWWLGVGTNGDPELVPVLLCSGSEGRIVEPETGMGPLRGARLPALVIQSTASLSASAARTGAHGWPSIRSPSARTPPSARTGC